MCGIVGYIGSQNAQDFVLDGLEKLEYRGYDSAGIAVNTGEDKGKTGRILEVLVKENRAVVEGINIVTKHTKPNAQNPQGGRVTKEASIHISNLNLLDPKSGKPSRIGRKEVDGKLVRYMKRSGEEIK